MTEVGIHRATISSDRMVRFEVEITARMRRFPLDRHVEVSTFSFYFRIEKRQLPVFFNLLLHRDLAPVQNDLAAACTDSGKLSRKCEYPP